ncbi:MAG: UDP-N-acetylmuramate dehydrogenase [Verrucomicrobiota bacterium]
MSAAQIEDPFGLPAGGLLFIGIGGMGMAPLAGWMQQSGYPILGYDDDLQQPVRAFLESTGVQLKDFLLADQLDGVATVVYSSAINEKHPLYLAAQKAGKLLLRRGELLARIAQTKSLIAVVGSHGKTTTTGMMAHLIKGIGLDVGYILGGFFSDAALPPCAVAESDWLVAEVDESDGTIDLFFPEQSIVLNIDWDHSDRYTSRAHLEEAFVGLVARTSGCVFVPEAGNLKARLMGETGAEVKTFGVGGDFAAEFLEDGRVALSGAFQDLTLRSLPPGRFNQTNGLAALASIASFAPEFACDALCGFSGIARRQTVLRQDDALLVVEDYAHHPAEVFELLRSLRAQEPEKRLVVVFQPHRYSRTKQFKAELAASLSLANAVYLLPVYAAHEPVIEGGRIEDLQAAFGGRSPEILEMNSAAASKLYNEVQREPTLLAFVGAGDIEIFCRVVDVWIHTKGDVDLSFVEYMQARISTDCVLKQAEPLAKKTTLRVGGEARFFAEPGNLSDLKALLRGAKLFGFRYFCMGRGSNLVVPDEGFDGLVIRFTGEAWRQIDYLGDGRFWVAAGARLKEVCGQAAKVGLAGFEFLEGIPGAVGGSLRMNAGAMGSWIFDVVERVLLLDADGQVQDLPKSAFHFGYRKVEEISRGVAIGAILKSPDHAAERSVRECMDSYSKVRKASQPRDPSAGCIFKNPDGNYAGKLIDEHGIKGMRVGAAEVSAVHGNFIVNRGGATATDVIELVRQVRAAVEAKSGYVLEPEVLLVGKTWDEVLSDNGVDESKI